ncbi:hypothetical protein AVEN_43844-1 [Araneus ventricosus]|uniref:Secreted protein n=1 Tax=Araneus ventricosus TaxID=182803 RepID=A0A4Y2SQU5_ARAVE|nr:hypothetical protein AVEN_43844-1 [Araneus ventricosus]
MFCSSLYLFVVFIYQRVNVLWEMCQLQNFFGQTKSYFLRRALNQHSHRVLTCVPSSGSTPNVGDDFRHVLARGHVRPRYVRHVLAAISRLQHLALVSNLSPLHLQALQGQKPC